LAAIKKLLEDLNISKVLFIDDQLELSDEEKIRVAEQYFTGDEVKQEIKDALTESLEKEVVEIILETGDLDFLHDDDDKREVLFKVLDKYESKLLEGPAKDIERKIINYFEDCEYDSALKPNQKKFKEYDLVIMDYNYIQGQLTALDIIKGQEFNEGKVTYIIIISSHKDFEYQDQTYKMINAESKQDLFRKYSSGNFLEFKALLNYISKDNVYSNEIFFQTLDETLLELESGKLMYTSLLSLKKLLDKGVNDAVRKLLLTNSKTLKALITDKLESEGISETTYLVDFSLSLVKNLINDSVSEMKEIHENLNNIQDWSCEIWDVETDEHLRSLRRIELLDENVNLRSAPIDFGDIFWINLNGVPIRGILLSQSCDLITRKNGGTIKRNSQVASIILESTEDNGKSCAKLRLGAEEIIFDVRHNLLLPTWILDFVSLDRINGLSKFNLNQSINREFTWGNYFHQYLSNLIVTKSEEFKNLTNEAHIMWSNGIAYKINRDGDVIDFNVSRIGRLDYLHTLSILKQKTELETRVPLPFDLSDKQTKYIPMKALLDNSETKLEFFYNEQEKTVLADFYDILEIITIEGYEINQEVSDKLISEITTTHKDKILLREQFSGKRMLKIDNLTLATFREHGISISINKNEILADVKCRHKKIAQKAL
jgi:hypothetical protein